MALQLDQPALGRLLQERLVVGRRWPDGTARSSSSGWPARHGPDRSRRSRRSRRRAASPCARLISAIFVQAADLVDQPVGHQLDHVDGERRRGVQQRLALGQHLVVDQRRQIGRRTLDQVVADDDDRSRPPGRRSSAHRRRGCRTSRSARAGRGSRTTRRTPAARRPPRAPSGYCTPWIVSFEVM